MIPAVYFFISLFLSICGVYGIRNLALKNNWIAHSTQDRWHKIPTALFGGVGFVSAWFLSTSLFLFIEKSSIPLTFVWIGFGSLLMFFTGLVDDILKLQPKLKLALQCIAASLCMPGKFVAQIFPWEPLNIALTLFWLVGLTNAANLLDNMDGLSSGVMMIISAGLALLFWRLMPSQSNSLTIVLIYTGACLGFLKFNFKPASIFMGDSGSLFLGYFLAAVAIPSSVNQDWILALQSLPHILRWFIPIILFIVPITDTSFVSFYRKYNGRKISIGGKDHLSHRLVFLGLSERQAVMVLYSISFLGILLPHLFLNYPSMLAVSILCFLSGVLTLCVFLGKLKVYV